MAKRFFVIMTLLVVPVLAFSCSDKSKGSCGACKKESCEVQREACSDSLKDEAKGKCCGLKKGNCTKSDDGKCPSDKAGMTAGSRGSVSERPEESKKDSSCCPSEQDEAKAVSAKESCQTASADFPEDKWENGVLWHTNFEASRKCAEEENKPLFVLFTGSDWCGWCKKLEGEALSSESFAEKTKDEFVFVKLDFPRDLPQSDALKVQNSKLKDEYGVRGFPTVMLFDSELRKIAQTGYQPGGGESYAEHLLKLTSEHNELKSKMASLDEENATVEELQELFEMSRRLGEKDYQKRVLSVGLKREAPYFLVERYQELLRGKGDKEEMAELKSKLSKVSDSETAYRLAIMEYVQRSFSLGPNAPAERLARPLKEYLGSQSAVDSDNAWRVQLQVANIYKREGNVEESEKYLQRALEGAPDERRKEVETALEALKETPQS